MEIKIIVISALAIVVMFLTIAQNGVASKGYWTANNALVQPGMKKDHIFLDGHILHLQTDLLNLQMTVLVLLASGHLLSAIQ
jgi:hypothetical protein